MALLIAVIADNLRDVIFKTLAITSYLFLALYDLSGINSYCNVATVSSFLCVSFSLVFPSFLFLLSLFLDLLNYLWLVRCWGASLSLRRYGFYLFGLIITRIGLIFRRPFSLGYCWSIWILPWILALASVILAIVVRSSQVISDFTLIIYNFIKSPRLL